MTTAELNAMEFTYRYLLRPEQLADADVVDPPSEPSEPSEPETPDEPEQPSGNPVIETLPFTYEVPAEGGLDMNGVYYDFTATEEITLGGIAALEQVMTSWDEK